MSLVKLQGIVLKSINLGESDKIVTIFSDKLGKIDVVAHGARRPKSKFMASIQPFCYGEYMVYKGKSLYTLSQSSIVESFQGILLNLDKVSYGSYFLELLDIFTENENRNISALGLILKTLYILNHGDVNLKLLRLIYDFKLVSVSGYMPQIKHCNICKSNLDFGYFSIRDGGIICSKCKDNAFLFGVNKEVIQFLHVLRNIKLEDLRNINYDDRIIDYVQNMLHKYITYYGEREIKSLTLINELNK